MRSDQGVLDEFVSLRPGAEPARETGQHDELVVRSRGGGTGIYTQVEGYYRMLHDELRNVLQFASRQYGSDPTGPAPSTTLKRSWFTMGPNGEWGGTLVEATTEFAAQALPRDPVGSPFAP